MKLHIGDLVQIKHLEHTTKGLFHDTNRGKYAVIEKKSHGNYLLKVFKEIGSTWYNSKDLILIAPGNRETFESHCAKMFKLVQF